MDVNLLQRDEVEVECLLRDIRFDTPDAIHQLEEAVRSEQADTKPTPGKMHTSASKRPDIEISTCLKKLEEIRGAITVLDPATKDLILLVQQYHSRLLHLAGRLSRAFKSPTYEQSARKGHQACSELLTSLQIYLDDQEKLNDSIQSAKGVHLTLEIPPPEEQKDEIQVQNLGSEDDSGNPQPQGRRCTLEDLLDQIQTNHTAVQQANAQTTLLESMMRNFELVSQQLVKLDQRQTNLQTQIVGNNLFSQDIPISTVQDRAPPTSTSSPVSPKFIDRRLLSGSGLSFTGSPSGINIDMFLFQVDTIASSRGLSEQILLLELHTILKDLALQWYWTFRKHNPHATWSELRSGMIERFQDRRTNYEIRRMVEARKQQPNESFLDFYNHVWMLTLQCRTPYSDEELIQILMNNMKPTLQYHLTDRQFSSIN